MRVTYLFDGVEREGNLLIEQRQPFLEGFDGTDEMLIQMIQIRPIETKISDIKLAFECYGMVIRRPKIIVPGMKVGAEPKVFELYVNRSKLNTDPDTHYVLQTVESWYNRAKEKRLRNQVANMTNKNPNKQNLYSQIK